MTEGNREFGSGLGDTEHRVWSDEGPGGAGLGSGAWGFWLQGWVAGLGALWMGELMSSVVAGIGGAGGMAMRLLLALVAPQGDLGHGPSTV